jgi:hypothetical protein
MKGSMSKERAKKMLRGQSLREEEPNFEQEISLDKVNQQEKHVVSISNKKVIFTKMDKP